MKEIWKDIKNYEGLYQISNFGRVRSLDRMVNSRSLKSKILKPDIVSGYLRVSLSKNDNRVNYLVHILVANAFIGIPEKGMQTDHKDGNKQNNYPENLEWVTRGENTKRFRNSISAKNRDIKACGHKMFKKLSLEDANLIRKLRVEYKFKTKRLSWLFSVSPNAIRDIINNKRWSNIINKEA